MKKDIKAFQLLEKLCEDKIFCDFLKEELQKGNIRHFNEVEWGKITSQNFVSPIPEMKNFEDMFMLGYNIGNCVGASRQLSYSYNNVDIVSGILPIIKGTLNAENEGGHCWLETPDEIIDTSLMLVINKELKSKFGYIEEQRVTTKQLNKSSYYQARKEFTNDSNLNRGNVL